MSCFTFVSLFFLFCYCFVFVILVWTRPHTVRLYFCSSVMGCMETGCTIMQCKSYDVSKVFPARIVALTRLRLAFNFHVTEWLEVSDAYSRWQERGRTVQRFLSSNSCSLGTVRVTSQTSESAYPIGVKRLERGMFKRSAFPAVSVLYAITVM